MDFSDVGNKSHTQPLVREVVTGAGTQDSDFSSPCEGLALRSQISPRALQVHVYISKVRWSGAVRNCFDDEFLLSSVDP